MPNVSFCEDERGVYYKPVHDYSQDYFTTVITTAGNVKWSGSKTTNTLSYSMDNGATWSTASRSITLQVNDGDKVLWKGTASPWEDEYEGEHYGIGEFSGDTNVRYSIEGNVMSLLFGDNFKGQTSLSGKNWALFELFDSNVNVTNAENLSLPATTLAEYCYYQMFYGCSSLTTAPELPATTLARSCYISMFYGCTNLTTVPELPATTLATSCYQDMFQNCTNLTTVPELPATTLAWGCYDGMFNGCTSLTTAPELPATTLANDCYRYMFMDCTNMTTAPELPATTLTNRCYQHMFSGCTKLSSIKCLATNISANGCTSEWVTSVKASGTFTKASSMTSWTTGADGIPSGWTVVDAA